MAPWMLLLLAVLAVGLCRGAAMDDPYALPAGLLIGAGVSAIQTEGAWNEDGKGESVADHLMHSGKLAEFSNDSHDVASNSYHRFSEDVKAAADLGLTLYRLSISWVRVLPDAVTRNEKGVQYYHNLIDEVLKYNMTPLVTLHHYDHPWILEEQFKGWQSDKMVNYFKNFAELTFLEYGAKVKLWITINEPNMYCIYYPDLLVEAGMYTEADLDRYACMRNMVLAHAEAYHVFKQLGHEGQLGVSALLITARPNSTRPEDVFAANVFNQFTAGVLLHPSVYGDYPDVVKEWASSKLEPFTETERERIKGTTDFISFNAYYGMIAHYTNSANNIFMQIKTLSHFIEDVPFVDLTIAGLDWANAKNMFSVIEPDVLRSAVLWSWNEYKLPLLISENGYADVSELGKNDHIRGVYHSASLLSLVSAMRDYSIPVIAYSAWSLIDSFEWSAGYGRPFGLIHVDYEGGSLNRSMKDSSQFWIELAKTGRIPLWEDNAASSAMAAATTSTAALLLLLVLAAKAAHA